MTPRRPPSFAISALLALAAAGVSPPAVPAADNIYSVQMHIHGSASEGTGTWYTHTIANQRAGVNVLWWSDHDDRLAYYEMQYADRFDFESGLTTTVESMYTEGPVTKNVGWDP